MKKRYSIGVREVHFRYYTVEADNEDQAKELVDQRAPSAVDDELLEYSHELPQDTWSVEEIPDKQPAPNDCQEGQQP
jgi:hypothetical protein